MHRRQLERQQSILIYSFFLIFLFSKTLMTREGRIGSSFPQQSVNAALGDWGWTGNDRDERRVSSPSSSGSGSGGDGGSGEKDREKNENEPTGRCSSRQGSV